MSKKLKIVAFIVGGVCIAALFATFSHNLKKHRSALKMADRFALESALGVRKALEMTLTCPEVPNGWEDFEYDHHDDMFVKRGNEYGWARVKYGCIKDNNFNISVLYSPDSATYYSGRPNETIKVTYGYFTSPKYIYVKDATQIESVLHQIYEQKRH